MNVKDITYRIALRTALFTLVRAHYFKKYEPSYTYSRVHDQISVEIDLISSDANRYVFHLHGTSENVLDTLYLIQETHMPKTRRNV